MGDLVFGDRDVTFTAIHESLTGAERIVTACDSKNSVGELAAFTAGADMMVYVALDSRVSNVPAWLSDYTKTELTATNSKDVIFVLYAKDVVAGERVILGENGQISGCVHYSVFAAEANTEPEIIAGDVNADGTFGIADVVMLQKWLVCAGDVTDRQAGDLDGDNRLTAVDLTLMKRKLIP